MEIRLECVDSLGITSTLHNGSARPVTVLHNPNLQPSRIILKDAAGREIKPLDNRTRAKFDRTVRAAMFQQVPAGGVLAMGSEKFRKAADGKYMLDWGPYSYSDISPGNWSASIVFESVINTPTGAPAIPNVWTGTVASGAVTVHLP